MNWRLPESLEIGGSDFRIRTDFRDILTIISAFTDPDLPDEAKTEVMMTILYPDIDKIPPEHMQEAADKGIEFIDHIKDDGTPKPRLMDWDQDADIIIPAVNKVAGVGDVRALPHMHWWTFLGYYMEIGESLYSQVLNIRYKRAHGQKLEKWEKDFERENRALVKLKKRLSEDEQEMIAAEEQALKELFGE